MPYVKIKIEVEYYIKSNDQLEEAIEKGVEDLYNISHDWVIEGVPPNVDSEVDEHLNLKFYYKEGVGWVE